MFFKLSADIKVIPINLDLVPDFGDFVPPIRASLSTRVSRKVKESVLIYTGFVCMLFLADKASHVTPLS